MSGSETSEVAVIEGLLPKYQAEGFDVYVNPSPSILPPFMQSYRPDAIALKKDKKIAIEVIRSTGSTVRKIQDLKSLFADQPEWELQVFYASPLSSETPLKAVSPELIEDSLKRILELKAAKHSAAALVMGWATFEAIGRALLPDAFRRPQTPARLVEVLATDGYLTPDEADTMRSVISVRNAIAHGFLESNVDPSQLDKFVAILSALASQLKK